VKTIAASFRARRPLPAAKPKTPIVPVRDAERTQRAIIAAAEEEFANKGLAGARVDTIAEKAGVNKRMLYYYFGSKDNLYITVLERAYGAMREAERELNLTDLDPLDAIRKLVEFKFDYYLANPRIIRLLAGENMQNAKFLKRSRQLRDMHNSLANVLRSVLTAGQEKALVKPGIDPLHLYISLASLSYFFFSNAATLTTAFGRELTSPNELKVRRAHAVEVMLDYVRAR
jgi:TetR/AcrR family transcriptional regulator